jgi:hypothetical protein
MAKYACKRAIVAAPGPVASNLQKKKKKKRRRKKKETEQLQVQSS